MTFKFPVINFSLSQPTTKKFTAMVENLTLPFIIGILGALSIHFFLHFYANGLGLSYNDARSHLDIGRRVVEGLKPGLAQIGSVWLPLPHLLMVPTIWNDFMWHSGLSGAIQSMISFVATGALIYLILSKFKVGLLGRIMGVTVFVANINVLYLQSTAMTELLLIATMTAGIYELIVWHQDDEIVHIIRSAFWIMLSTLIRYDGWFLLVMATGLVVLHMWRRFGRKAAEGIFFLFCTLAGVGIIMWFLWNLLIFKDPLYFAFGPFSAHAQQQQLEQAGVLATKGNLPLSIAIYIRAFIYNAGAYPSIIAMIGAVVLFMDKRIKSSVRIASTALFAPLFFNIIALYLGHSVLFIQGISGNTWFNVRYGLMLIPTIAILFGYLVDRVKPMRPIIIGLYIFFTIFFLANYDAVTIDDARVGSSQKNVSEVSSWLEKYTKDEKGFILISAASHDAIIFSSGLPMKRFIHEGTGAYWESATTSPDRWARWIIMRTNDNNDLTFNAVRKTPGYARYDLVGKYPFADIYQLKPEYLPELNTEATLKNNK